MKIAVINSNSSVGGWKWVYSVFSAIKQYFPQTQITVFYRKNYACTYEVQELFNQAGIETKKLTTKTDFAPRKLFYVKFLDVFYNFIRKMLYKRRHQKCTKLINQYDIVFHSWPYSPNELVSDKPTCFIPHDFIFTHFFGLHCMNAYSREQYIQTKKILKKYIDMGAHAFTGTEYIANELKRTFPEYKQDVNVILLSQWTKEPDVDENTQKNILKDFGIKNDYILLATNNMHHKNMEEALSAYYLVKQKYPDIKMIIIGADTAGIAVKVNSLYYCDHIDNEDEYDVKSLGMVSEEALTTLMKNAKLLLNVSLCEAACGSGLDAWQLGTPTAISDIPPYIEQVKKLGVKTEFFNPKNSTDIARAILHLLDNPDIAQENARLSQKAFENNWSKKDMASAYMSAFEKILSNTKQN